MYFLGKRKNKGQAFGTDYVIGIAIFLTAISIGIVYSTTGNVIISGFSKDLESSTENSVVNFENFANWDVFSTPLSIESRYKIKNKPIKVNFSFDSNTDRNSTEIKRGKSLLNSQINYSNDKVYFVSDLNSGSNEFSIIHTENTNLSQRDTTDNLNITNNVVENNKIKTEFVNSGVSYFIYNNEEYFNGSAIINVSSEPFIQDNGIRALISYSNGRNIELFDNNSEMRFLDLQNAQNWSINLSNRFKSLYSYKENSTYDLNSTGTLYSGTSDWIDLYNETGFSIMGENIEYTILKESEGSKIEIQMSIPESTGEIAFYAHEGNFSNAFNWTKTFYSPPNITIGFEEIKRGLSAAKITKFEGKTSESKKSILGVSGFNYNFTIQDLIESGAEIPSNKEAVIINWPVIVLERFGNHTVKELKTAVWM